MVDARLPAEWLGSIRIDNLSDRAFRILAGALMWCNGQGTDGSVPARYTKYLHPDGDDQDAFDELEAAGLWIAGRRTATFWPAGRTICASPPPRRWSATESPPDSAKRRTATAGEVPVPTTSARARARATSHA